MSGSQANTGTRSMLMLQHASRFSYDAQGRLEYIGETFPQHQAKMGSMVWRIRKVIYVSADSEDMSHICWAGKSSGYKFEWTKRETYDYS